MRGTARPGLRQLPVALPPRHWHRPHDRWLHPAVPVRPARPARPAAPNTSSNSSTSNPKYQQYQRSSAPPQFFAVRRFDVSSRSRPASVPSRIRQMRDRAESWGGPNRLTCTTTQCRWSADHRAGSSSDGTGPQGSPLAPCGPWTTTRDTTGMAPIEQSIGASLYCSRIPRLARREVRSSDVRWWPSACHRQPTAQAAQQSPIHRPGMLLEAVHGPTHGIGEDHLMPGIDPGQRTSGDLIGR